MFNLEEELKKLPAKPGVYIMHDKWDNIIYIGKAKILKNRVRQYFQSSRNKSAKIVQMVSHIQLKDDKSYPFIKITVGEEYPRVLFARKMKHGAGKYFGPYTSAAAVKDTIELLCKLYKVRTCNRNLPKDEGKDRPCLNYHIGQCDAPCQGYVSGEEYRRRRLQQMMLMTEMSLRVQVMVRTQLCRCSLSGRVSFLEEIIFI